MPLHPPLQVSRVDAFDRVRFRLDNPIPNLALERIARLCRDVFLTESVVPYQARWTYDLDVLQPHHPTFFPALEDALSAGTTCQPYYVEVARDYLTSHQAEARRMAQHFVGHALLRYSRGHVRTSGAGVYYNPRGSSTVLAVYGDRPTKQFDPNFGRPALHTELRFNGLEALGREGLRGLQDLAQPDFDKIWKRHLSLGSQPSQMVVGAAVGCRSARKDSLQRAARKAIAEDGTLENGTFALQKLVGQYAGVGSVIEPLTFKKWEREARNFALTPSWFSAR
jgi:hypothetical protein